MAERKMTSPIQHVVEGWREIRRRALDTYWLRRRNGGSENEALSAVLDDIYRDDTIEEIRRDMREFDVVPPPHS